MFRQNVVQKKSIAGLAFCNQYFYPLQSPPPPPAGWPAERGCVCNCTALVDSDVDINDPNDRMGLYPDDSADADNVAKGSPRREPHENEARRSNLLEVAQLQVEGDGSGGGAERDVTENPLSGPEEEDKEECGPEGGISDGASDSIAALVLSTAGGLAMQDAQGEGRPGRGDDEEDAEGGMPQENGSSGGGGSEVRDTGRERVLHLEEGANDIGVGGVGALEGAVEDDDRGSSWSPMQHESTFGQCVRRSRDDAGAVAAASEGDHEGEEDEGIAAALRLSLASPEEQEQYYQAAAAVSASGLEASGGAAIVGESWSAGTYGDPCDAVATAGDSNSALGDVRTMGGSIVGREEHGDKEGESRGAGQWVTDDEGPQAAEEAVKAAALLAAKAVVFETDALQYQAGVLDAVTEVGEMVKDVDAEDGDDGDDDGGGDEVAAAVADSAQEPIAAGAEAPERYDPGSTQQQGYLISDFEDGFATPATPRESEGDEGRETGNTVVSRGGETDVRPLEGDGLTRFPTDAGEADGNAGDVSDTLQLVPNGTEEEEPAAAVAANVTADAEQTRRELASSSSAAAAEEEEEEDSNGKKVVAELAAARAREDELTARLLNAEELLMERERQLESTNLSMAEIMAHGGGGRGMGKDGDVDGDMEASVEAAVEAAVAQAKARAEQAMTGALTKHRREVTRLEGLLEAEKGKGKSAADVVKGWERVAEEWGEKEAMLQVPFFERERPSRKYERYFLVWCMDATVWC